MRAATHLTSHKPELAGVGRGHDCCLGCSHPVRRQLSLGNPLASALARRASDPPKRMLGRRGGASPVAGSAAVEANPRTTRIAAIDLVTALSFGAPQAGRPVRADLSSRRWPATSRACCDRRRGILVARRLGSRQFSGCLGGRFCFSPISAPTSSSGTGGKSYSCKLPGLGSLQPPEPWQSGACCYFADTCRHLTSRNAAQLYRSPRTANIRLPPGNIVDCGVLTDHRESRGLYARHNRHDPKHHGPHQSKSTDADPDESTQRRPRRASGTPSRTTER